MWLTPKTVVKNFWPRRFFLRSWRNFWLNRRERTIGQISKNGEVVTKNQPRSHPIRWPVFGKVQWRVVNGEWSVLSSQVEKCKIWVGRCWYENVKKGKQESFLILRSTACRQIGKARKPRTSKLRNFKIGNRKSRFLDELRFWVARKFWPSISKFPTFSVRLSGGYISIIREKLPFIFEFPPYRTGSTEANFPHQRS